MIQIDDYNEHQLDRATSILIDLFERFTYDTDSMILYYKNSTISELQATVLYYGELAKTIVDDSIESCEELRKFMENIGVEDTSIIDYIENILRKGGEVIDAAVQITERVNNPDQPTPDVTCSDSSDDYEDWEDEPTVTDETRDAEIERIAPEPEVVKELEETKKAEVDPAKVEEARAKQEEADKAADKAAQARAEAATARANANEAAEKYEKALEDLKDTSKGGYVVEKDDTTWNKVAEGVNSFIDLVTGSKGNEARENGERSAVQNIIDNARAAANNAAAEVIAKGGTQEEATKAYSEQIAKGIEGVIDAKDGDFAWTVSNNTTGMAEDVNAIAEAVNARDEAAKAELGAQTAEEAAHAAQNAAETAAAEAAEAVEEANNPPCADCDCDCDSCDSCDCDCDETPCDSTPCSDDTPPCSDDTCVGDCDCDCDCADAPCADCADTPCADCADTPCPDCTDCASDTDVCPGDAYCDACDE